MTMSSDVFEKSARDSNQRWEDDGGAIPPTHSNSGKAVLTLQKWKAARKAASGTTKPSTERNR
jgi:hypothetical protein